jgi:BolA protein
MGAIATEIERRLRSAFSPDRIEIIDDSHKHLGHAGHRAGGESHFTVAITAAAFAGLSRVAKQRAVYTALGDLMAPDRIHALIIRSDALGH